MTEPEASVTNLLEPYPVIVEIPVAWGDMDAMGHVNNTEYFRYFETARMHLFERLGIGGIETAGGIGPILHSTNCRFRIPLTYPDVVTVGVRVGDIAEDRFVTRYCVVSHRYGAAAADGEGLVVTYDYQAGTKARIPDSLRDQLHALQGA